MIMAELILCIHQIISFWMHRKSTFPRTPYIKLPHALLVGLSLHLWGWKWRLWDDRGVWQEQCQSWKLLLREQLSWKTFWPGTSARSRNKFLYYSAIESSGFVTWQSLTILTPCYVHPYSLLERGATLTWGGTVCGMYSVVSDCTIRHIPTVLRASLGFLSGSVVKNLPANAGSPARDVGLIPGLGWSTEEMATHSSILAWEIPWTEEPGGL